MFTFFNILKNAVTETILQSFTLAFKLYAKIIIIFEMTMDFSDFNITLTFHTPIVNKYGKC